MEEKGLSPFATENSSSELLANLHLHASSFEKTIFPLYLLLRVTMESFRGQGGIRMLLCAEQEAQHIVPNARNSKLDRLKQAKEEAESEVACYQYNMESEFQTKISQQLSGRSGDAVKRTGRGNFDED